MKGQTMTTTSIIRNPRQLSARGDARSFVEDHSLDGASLERINVNGIEVPDYQRDIRPTKLKTMIRDWNPSMAGWIIVSRRDDGSLFVIDGQHRVEAVRHLQGRVGPYLDGIVVDNWSTTQEAAFFYQTQNPDRRAALNPEDIHHAALLAGDQRAIDIQHILSLHGFRVGNRHTDSPETGRLKPVRAINSAYDRYGGALLGDVLATIRSAWGIQSSPEGCVVTGMALFFGMYPGVSPDDVAKRMGKTPIGEWVRLAKVHARSEGMTPNEGIAYKARSDYNFNRAAANRLSDFADTLRDHRAAIRSQAVTDRMKRDGLPAAFIANHKRIHGGRT